MLLIKNDKSQLVKNFNLNIGILAILEMILNPEWRERICNIQINWSSHYKFAEINNFCPHFYVHLLTDEVSCFINVQHYKEAQFNKEDFDSYNLPKQLLDFVLDEPLISLGTTNLMWSNGVELNSLNDKLNSDEKKFISLFFSEPDLNEINSLIGKKYDYEINLHQFDILQTFVNTKEISRVLLQSAFDITKSNIQIEEVSEAGFKIW